MAAACREDRSDCLTYLLRSAERESLDREKWATERRNKAANFHAIKIIDTFDFKALPSTNDQPVRELMRSEYIDRKENVLFWKSRNR